MATPLLSGDKHYTQRELSSWRTSLRTEDRLLLTCARQRLTEADSEILCRLLREPINWDYVIQAGRWHSLIGLLFHHLKSPQNAEITPPPVLDSLKSEYLQNTARQLFRRTELARLLAILEAKGIPVIVLKGAALIGTVYSVSGLRPMGDLDLMVPEAQVFTVQAIIQSLGYQPVGTPEQQHDTEGHHRHLPGLRNQGTPVMFEVHRHIVRRDSGLYFNIDGFWERAIETSVVGTKALALAPEDLLLHLALNFFLDRQLRSKKALRQLCDISEVIRYYLIDWDNLAQRSNAYQVAGPLACSIRLAQVLLDAPAPTDFVHYLAPGLSDADLEKFARQRVIPVRGWVASGLVESGTPNGGLGLLHAMVRRIVPPREYMRLHYGGAGFKAYRRRMGQALGFLVRFARHPSELSDDLSVDKWMRSLYGQQAVSDSKGVSEANNPFHPT
jgi:hypothetical protein